MNSLIEGFFHRIHYEGSQSIQLNDLDQLMFQFAKCIPFENSSVLMKDNNMISFESLKERIIDQFRGGVCYELNPFFYYILKELGFDVKMLAATIFGNEAYGLIRTHIIILLIENGEKYLIDVGSIAHAALQPVPFTNRFVNRLDERFRIRDCQTEYGTHVLETFHGEELETGYYFDLTPIDETHINKVKKIIQNDPHTLLNQSVLLSNITDDGRQTLTKHSYTVTNKGVKLKQEIDEDTFNKLRYEKFGLAEPY